MLFVVVVCSIPFSFQYRKIMLEQVEESNISAMTQSRNAVATMEQISTNITEQVFTDLNVAWLLYGKDYDPIQMNVALTQLHGYRASIPYIDSIYIYNGLTQTMTVSSSYNGMCNESINEPDSRFTDLEVVEMIHDTEGRYSRYRSIPRRVTVSWGGRDQTILLYTFMRSQTFGGGPLGSAVFINFSYEWLEQMSHVSEPGEYLTLITDLNGRVVSDHADFPMGTDLADALFFQRICEANEAYGSFTEVISGQRMMVSYLAPDSYGWRYIRLVPEEHVNKGFWNIMTYMAVVMACIVAMGLLITLLLSKMLYLPVGRVHDEMNALEEKNRKIENFSKQHLLRNLLFGTGGSLAPIKQAVFEVSIPTDSQTHYQIVLMKIKNYRSFVSRYDPRDQALMRYGILNILSEICKPPVPCECVDIGEENEIVLIMASPEPLSWSKTEWEDFLLPLSAAVQQALSLSLHFVVGGSCQGIDALPTQYHKTKEACIYRILYGEEPVIMAQWFMHFSSTEYSYPVAREDAMVEAITSAKAEKAKDILKEILYGTAEYPYAVINLAVAQVALSLNTLTKELQKGHFLELSEEVNAAIMSATELSEETIPNFYHAIEEIVSAMEDRRSTRHVDLINSINQFIQAQFANPDCSVDLVAQAFSMSSAHMGRIYKRYTMKSISETIFAVRMDNARKLLRGEKKISVAEVAKRSGFASSSYFSKAFRKEQGMTPNEFRNHAGPADSGH